MTCASGGSKIIDIKERYEANKISKNDVRKEIANLQREERKRLANRNKTGTGCSNVNKIIFN